MLSPRVEHVISSVAEKSPRKRNVISTKASAQSAGATRRNLLGYFSDTIITAPRSVRSLASTLRKIGSKSLKRRTREEEAGKGEFAFTECRNFHFNLAQNCSICAKEEPQAIKRASRVHSACGEISLAATRRAARHDKVVGLGFASPRPLG